MLRKIGEFPPPLRKRRLPGAVRRERSLRFYQIMIPNLACPQKLSDDGVLVPVLNRIVNQFSEFIKGVF